MDLTPTATIAGARPEPAGPHWLPRSAYVHIPFCAHKCGYCDFASVAGQDEMVEALIGLRKIAEGDVKLSGRDVTGANPRLLHQLGVGFVPADRHRFGITTGMDDRDRLPRVVLSPRLHADPRRVARRPDG